MIIKKINCLNLIFKTVARESIHILYALMWVKYLSRKNFMHDNYAKMQEKLHLYRIFYVQYMYYFLLTEIIVLAPTCCNTEDISKTIFDYLKKYIIRNVFSLVYDCHQTFYIFSRVITNIIIYFHYLFYYSYIFFYILLALRYKIDNDTR